MPKKGGGLLGINQMLGDSLEEDQGLGKKEEEVQASGERPQENEVVSG